MNRHSKQLAWMAGAGVILGLSGSVWAQEGFDKPLKATKDKAPEAATSTASTTTMMMRQDDGDNAYELRIQGDQVTAKVNGKEVPAERIQRDKDAVRILDKDGKVVASFQISVDGSQGGGTSVGGNGRRSNRMRSFSMPAQPGQPAPPAPPATPQPEPPKVMIGINMAPANADQLKEAGLKEDSDAIVIERVIPDLPAEKAGLREGDLITEIDGQAAGEEKLREVMKGKKPGDTVKVTVRRNGADKTIRIQVAKYDAAKLPMVATPTPDPNNWTTWPNSEDYKKLMKQYEGQTLVMPGAPGGQIQLFSPGNNAKVDEKMAELDKKMSELDDRLSKLSDQMSRLEKLIDKLNRGKD